RVGTLIRGRENALDSNLLRGIVKEIGHPLRSLDHRKRELRLSGRVVGGGEIPQPDELVLRRETLLQSLEQGDRPFWVALLEESASLEQRVLRRRRGGSAAEKIRWLHPEDPGDVLERFHGCTRAAGFEHRDVGLGVLRLGYLSLGKA